MSRDYLLDPVLLLSPQWWRRLQWVAATCYLSPRDFVLQAIEAEIVRRELLLRERGDLDPVTAHTPNLSRLCD